jgi:hypothetical protein
VRRIGEVVERQASRLLLSGRFRGRTPGEGEAMYESIGVLTIALLVALLVIDRLTR